jgi:hypothetical protein
MLSSKTAINGRSGNFRVAIMVNFVHSVGFHFPSFEIHYCVGKKNLGAHTF